MNYEFQIETISNVNCNCYFIFIFFNVLYFRDCKINQKKSLIRDFLLGYFFNIHPHSKDNLRQ